MTTLLICGTKTPRRTEELAPIIDAGHGSFWGNYNDLSEVVALVEQGKIRHSVKTIRFEDVNELLRNGDIVGRAVIRY